MFNIKVFFSALNLNTKFSSISIKVHKKLFIVLCFLMSISYTLSSSTPLILSVQGITGAGKSTFIKILEKNFNAVVIDEPIERWLEPLHVDGSSIFDLLRKDPKAWSLAFQMHAFITRLYSFVEAVKNHPKAELIITDRSIDSGSECFTPLLHAQGHLVEEEVKLYYKNIHDLRTCCPVRYDGHIYLRTNPVISHKRANGRNRKEDCALKLDFFTGLYEQHERWLIEKKLFMSSESLATPVCVLDGDSNFKDDQHMCALLINQVKDFIKTLHSVNV